MSRTGNDSSQPTLTVIVPVYNEAATLEECLRQVLRAPYVKQVLVVDDGSTDGTAPLLERISVAGPIDVLRHECNRGKGAAIRTALPFATGRFTIIQDGDLELSPDDYPRLIEPLLADEADCVVGSRFRNSRHLSLNRLGVSLLNACVSVLYGVRLTDQACGYKALATRTLRQMELQCERFEFCPEVVAKSSRLGLRILEAPVTFRPRRAVDGKKLRYRDGVSALRTLWRWRRWVPKPIGEPALGGCSPQPSLRTSRTDEPIGVVTEARS